MKLAVNKYKCDAVQKVLLLLMAGLALVCVVWVVALR